MSHGSFTGRTRDRRTSWRVRLADVVARFVITVGGIGTIAAVLTVGVFLVVSVLPLFLPASIAPAAAAGVNWGGPPPIDLEVDEYQTMAAAVLPDGRVDVFGIAGGQPSDGQTQTPLSTQKLFDGGPKMTAWSFSPTSPDAAFGFEDGTIRLGTISFSAEMLKKDYLDALEPAKKAQLAVVRQGQFAPFEGGLVTLTNTMQYRWQRLVVKIGPPLAVDPEDKSAIVRLDHLLRGEVASTCVLQESGALRFRTGSPVDLATISPPAMRKLGYAASVERGAPDWIRLTGLGENALLVWKDGHCIRFATAAGAKNLPPVEEVDLTPEDGVQITAFEMLLGRRTLIVGDSKGKLAGWFRIRPPKSPNRDGATLTRAHEFPAAGAAVSRITPSPMNQTFGAAFGDGNVSVYHMTTDRLIVAADIYEGRKPSDATISALALGSDGTHPVLLAATNNALRGWKLTSPHPEVSAKALLGQVWYESYPKPEFVWQSSGGEGYEPKYSLIPLIFGTLKATFYSLLFGVPIALAAAIYTSEFLTPQVKAVVKPSIELMASLPSVVLGFLGGLVLAPLVDLNLGFTLSLLATVPLTLLMGAYLWQLLPYKLSLELAPYRFIAILLCAPLGVYFAWLVGPEVETLFFDGNLKGWLRGPTAEGRYASTLGAWTFLLFPAAVAGCVAFVSTVLNPWQRDQAHHWSRNGCAWFDIFKFLGGVTVSILLAVGVAAALGAAGFDPRGDGYEGSQPYDQRNALIVGFVMGFAIIPLIYTISEDALAAVPEQLRSASLGAGATPWQTAVRIIIPTAMSGLFSAVMIGLGRAVGETMIVLMATGNTPIMDFDVFNGFRTLSANLAEELPESVPGTTHYRILFLAGLTLFVTTFIINTVAEWVRLRFRKRSYAV